MQVVYLGTEAAVPGPLFIATFVMGRIAPMISEFILVLGRYVDILEIFVLHDVIISPTSSHQ